MKKRSMLSLALIACIFLTGLLGLAEGSAPEFIFTNGPIPNGIEIIDFKVSLYNYGFYSAGVQNETLQSLELDDLTRAAVKGVCDLNEGLTYYNEGVTFDVWWRVMGKDERYDFLNTPVGPKYFKRDIPAGTQSDAVNRLRARLIELGYDKCGYELERTGALDENLKAIFALFCESNGLIYDSADGAISAELQERLFAEDAAAPLEPAKLKFPYNLFAYMKRKSTIAGFEIPNFVIWCVGFVLLAAIVFLTVKLLTPSEDKGDGQDLKKGMVEFTVEYEGETFVHRSKPYEYTRIGRATGSFPLNKKDGSVSRRHCEIYFDKGDLLLRDFSSFGTEVNGEKCNHTMKVLHDRDVLTVGSHKITVHFI